MRKIPVISLFFLFIVSFGYGQSVGIGTSAPDSSAQLDVFSNNKGFLPPRVALTATNILSPVQNPATGLLVYNTATSGVSPVNVSPGYYYWNGNSWYPVVNKGKMPGDMQYWDGEKWILIPLGVNGQVLTICNGKPQWGSCFTTLTIQPSQNQYEGFVDNFYPNTINNSTQQLDMAAWTANGNFVYQRTFIKFDFSIPPTAVIDSARLHLYATTNPQGGNGVDPHFGSNNVCIISRITTPWTSPNLFTWNNQPSFSTTNQVLIPQSVTATDDNIMDVTSLVSDMITLGNHGFHIRLQNEVIYNIRQYASSRHPDANKHPKLVIYYH